MSIYLITGKSGSGKTTIACALAEMGFSVVHGDEQLVTRGSSAWEWDKQKFLKLTKSNKPVYVCGGADNDDQFFEYFKKIYVLEAHESTLIRRLAARDLLPKLPNMNYPSVKSTDRDPTKNVKVVRINADKSTRAVVYDILHS